MDRSSYRRPIKQNDDDADIEARWQDRMEERKPLPKWLSILPPTVRKVVGSPFLTLALVGLLLYLVNRPKT